MADNTGDHLLVNQTGDDFATGIAAGLFDRNSNFPIKLNTEKDIPIANNQAKLSFIAKYVVTKT